MRCAQRELCFRGIACSCYAADVRNELFDRRALVQAADSGSFTSAARALGVTVSTITRLVARVERTLGAKLFVRSVDGIAPTEAGRLYVDHVRAVLHGESDVREKIGAVVDGRAGSLRISVPIFIADHVLPSVVPSFLRVHSGTRLIVHASDDRVDLVRDGFDLAIRLGPLPDSSLRAQRLADYRAVLVAAPGFFAKRDRPTHPSEVASLPCLAYGAHRGRVEWSFRRGSERRGSERIAVSIAPVVCANSVDLLTSLVSRGLGVSMLPEWVLDGHLPLAQVLEPWATRGTLYAVHPDDPERRACGARSSRRSRASRRSA